MKNEKQSKKKVLSTLALSLVVVIAYHLTFLSASGPVTYYISTTGNDSNTCSLSSPCLTLNHTIGLAHPGDTLLFATGTYTTDTTFISKSGAYQQPITISSQDHAHPALLKQRVVTNPGADYLVFSYIDFDGLNVGGFPSITVGSSNISFLHDDITNEHTEICLNAINDPTFGTSYNLLVDSSTIHDCGVLPATNLEHGLYLSGFGAIITNNYIYNNADRGIQLRGSQNAVVRNNIIDNNGEGVIFGDLTASGNNVYNNIVSNANIRYNVESFWGSTPVGTNNALHDNCFWTTRTAPYGTNGGIDSSITGVAVSNSRIANPLYIDPTNADYRLAVNSPCIGYGPESAQPVEAKGGRVAERLGSISNEQILVFNVSRTDTTSTNIFQLPGGSFISRLSITGVASNAGTTATVSVGNATSGTAYLNAQDVTANLNQSLPSGAVLGSVGANPIQLTTIYAETGTASTTGGPWTIVLGYVLK